MPLPPRSEQIRSAHAAFIRKVVETCGDPERRSELESLFNLALENGWTALVGALRAIAGGRRDPSVLQGLDEEDTVIAESILQGLQDPTTLPDVGAKADPALAVPGLASMIHAAARGNAEALMVISNMAEQMSRAGGNMARLAAVMRPLINGERDPDKLCKGVDARTENLVLGILEELGRLDLH